MLPKSRILSVLLLGLGVALMAAGLVTPRFLNFSPRLPLDIEATTWTFKDEHAKSQMITGEGASLYEGPMTYQINMDVHDPADESMATVRVGESAVRGGSGNVEDLFAARVWTYAMDRLTGEALGEATLAHTMGSPTARVPMDGYWLKFPAGAEQTTYPVFDPILRRTVDAVFEEALEIDGREVYRYHQQIDPVNLATVYPGGTTTTFVTEVQKEEPAGGEGGEGGEGEAGHGEEPGDRAPAEPAVELVTEQGYLFHMGSRDYYVDQATGLVVGMDMAIDDYWGDRTGAGREPQFVFTGSTSDEDRAALLAQAARFPRSITGDVIRYGGIGLGAVLALLGAVGALGGFARRRRQAA